MVSVETGPQVCIKPHRNRDIFDLDSDGSIEWLVHTGAGVSMYEHDALFQSQPVNGSIRQHTKLVAFSWKSPSVQSPLFGGLNAGMQEPWWLDGSQATVQYLARTTIDLPINDPQYTTRPLENPVGFDIVM